MEPIHWFNFSNDIDLDLSPSLNILFDDDLLWLAQEFPTASNIAINAVNPSIVPAVCDNPTIASILTIAPAELSPFAQELSGVTKAGEGKFTHVGNSGAAGGLVTYDVGGSTKMEEVATDDDATILEIVVDLDLDLTSDTETGDSCGEDTSSEPASAPSTRSELATCPVCKQAVLVREPEFNIDTLLGVNESSCNCHYHYACASECIKRWGVRNCLYCNHTAIVD